MSEPKTKTAIVHVRVPQDLFDWSMEHARRRGWTGAQYMRLLMEAQRERTTDKRDAQILLQIALEPLITKPTESPAVEANGH